MDVKAGILGDAWGSVAVCREQCRRFRVPGVSAVYGRTLVSILG
ncbi:MAG: hypothetical protein Q7T40_08740 [Methylobacter sp.]|nr:hypothetical protein [Methylobacter sp.]